LYLFLRVLFGCGIAIAAYGQDKHDWQSVFRLRPGDQLQISSKAGTVRGDFQNSTAEAITVGAKTLRRDEVMKVERIPRGGSRAKHALIGAAIGGGSGALIGAGVAGCDHNQIAICVTHTQGAGIVGGAGAVVGALVGLAWPCHLIDVIYLAK
jgi:hypothetical protein